MLIESYLQIIRISKLDKLLSGIQLPQIVFSYKAHLQKNYVH